VSLFQENDKNHRKSPIIVKNQVFLGAVVRDSGKKRDFSTKI